MSIKEHDKTKLIRQLVPKSYSFDAYNEINCSNSRDAPFFSDNVIQIGDYHLVTEFINPDLISLKFSSVCHFDSKDNEIRIDIEQFCLRMCKAGRSYYEKYQNVYDFSLYFTPVLEVVEEKTWFDKLFKR